MADNYIGFSNVETLETLKTWHNNAELARADDSARHYDNFDGELRQFIYRFVCNHCYLTWEESNGVSQILKLFEPTFSMESGAMRIAYWPDKAKRDLGESKETLSDMAKIRAMGKPGKAFRRFFPNCPETLVAKFTDEYAHEYSPSRFTLKTGSDIESFNTAYNKPPADYQNLQTTQWRKSLATSCMRYEHFHDWSNHPAAAYASGDFTSVYAIETDNRIAARCVVRSHKNGSPLETPRHAPVYGVSEKAIDFIESHLVSIGAKRAEADCRHNGFIGARLALLPHGSKYLAPYSDISPRSAQLSDNEEYMIIANYGDIDLSNTCGTSFVDLHHGTCDNCDCHMDDDDSYHDNGQTLCHECYYENRFTCERCEDSHSDDESNTVYVSQRAYGNNSESWCNDCCRIYATECEDGEHWNDDNVTYSADNDALSPDDLDSGDWTYCDDLGEWHAADQCGADSNGNYHLICDLEDRGMTYDSYLGYWTLPEEEEESGLPLPYRCDLTLPLPLPDPLPAPAILAAQAALAAWEGEGGHCADMPAPAPLHADGLPLPDRGCGNTHYCGNYSTDYCAIHCQSDCRASVRFHADIAANQTNNTNEGIRA